MYQALNVIVKGKVQGVGFRPYVYALSKKYDLKGTVQNQIESVAITIEGEEAQVYKMLQELKKSPPKLAKINDIQIHSIPLRFYEDFTILKSNDDAPISTLTITQDAAICDNCLNEMKDPQNRRFQYPLINCTQCGPRYTIIQRFPYDRPNTTMDKFPMCLECQKEYNNPLDRRHHAQPISCFNCGPNLKLLNNKGEQIAANSKAIFKTKEFLKQGKIVAIKGLGGYHLACDAKQAKTIDVLRKRKNRPEKPLAIMVKSLDVARKLCHVSPAEEKLLISIEMPIVLLKRKINDLLPENIAPGLTIIGIMSTYTPLHHLLFEDDQLEYLVMTSANQSGFPIYYKESDHAEFYGLCDYILTHNREIAHPIDDSVVQHNGKYVVFNRRARGFAPETMETNINGAHIIALGGYQKNTIAIGNEHNLTLGPQIGDLNNEEMINSFNEQLYSLKDWNEVNEKYLAVDLHPAYATTMLAKQSESKMVQIQHHHAHHVACMQEHNIIEPCLGIILDGTGYGEDGHIWGFEFLYGNSDHFTRLGHLTYTPLPGGEKAIKEPWRNAVGMLISFFKEEGIKFASQLFPKKLEQIHVIEQMIQKQLNTPMAGTCGRLFDAISAILGICINSTYEGEPAIKLSDYMNRIPINETTSIYPFKLFVNEQLMFELDMSPMIRQIVIDRLEHKPRFEIIQKFHQTIVESCVQMILKIIKKSPNVNRNVVLSGGSFQNNYLSREIETRLQDKGLKVFVHQNLPCHDGNLAIGQLLIAAHQIANNKK